MSDYTTTAELYRLAQEYAKRRRMAMDCRAFDLPTDDAERAETISGSALANAALNVDPVWTPDADAEIARLAREFCAAQNEMNTTGSDAAYQARKRARRALMAACGYPQKEQTP